MSDDETTTALTDALMQLSFALQSEISRVGAAVALSNTQVRMLAVLEDRRIGMAELASILELEKSSVSGLVDRAEKRGLVRREPSSEDRRAIHVVLTDEARAMVIALRAEVHRNIHTFVEPLSSDGQAGLFDSVTTILDARLRAIPTSSPPPRPPR